MTNNILRFTPGLNPELVKSVIQDSYRQLCSRDWSRLRLIRNLTTVAPHSAGTVAVNSVGVVTGTGTNFTPEMVGSFMRVHHQDAFFEVASYASPTSITLSNWSGVVVPPLTKYSIFKTIYTVDSLFGSVFSVTYQIALRKRSQSLFNQLDPTRLATSPSPTAWAYAGVSSTGAIRIELYPVPSSVVSLRVQGKIKASVLEDDDVPLLPEDLVESLALLDCYKLKDLQQPKQGWDRRAHEHTISYATLLEMYEDEDREADAHISKVKDMMSQGEYPIDDNFAVSHDVGW